MDGKLLCEVIQGEERMARIEALLVLTVTALHLAVVAGRIGANQLVADSQLRQQSASKRVGRSCLLLENGW